MKCQKYKEAYQAGKRKMGWWKEGKEERWKDRCDWPPIA